MPNYANPRYDRAVIGPDGEVFHWIDMGDEVPEEHPTDGSQALTDLYGPDIRGFEAHGREFWVTSPPTLTQEVARLINRPPPFVLLSSADTVPYHEVVARFDRKGWEYTFGRSCNGRYFVHAKQRTGLGFIASM